MDKKNRQKIFSKREVVKYSADRAYFGKFKAKNLSDAYAQFRHSRDWEKPITSANVVIGKIDGTVICRALWYEMSYNPARFGRVSPFIHNGREDIYHFCRNGAPANFPGAEIIERIQQKLANFLWFNGCVRLNKGEWYDVIDAKDGIITIRSVDEHSDNNYKVLAKLREIIRIVTNQNLEDFKRKDYRNQMLTVINKRHPNGVRDVVAPVAKKVSDFPRMMTPEEIEEERMDRAEESARITAENRKYVPLQQYEQARADLQNFADMRARKKTK